MKEPLGYSPDELKRIIGVLDQAKGVVLKQILEKIQKQEKLTHNDIRIMKEYEAEFKAQKLETLFQSLAEELGIKWGLLIHPTRVALSGRTYGPGLFEMMELLGKEKCLERLTHLPAVVETWRGELNK